MERPKIAEQLQLTTSNVYNVVRRNGLVRKRRGTGKAETVALGDAPNEAWQQAVLPSLHKAATARGFDGPFLRAVIILALLRWKPYPSLPKFEAWARAVTKFDPEEIALFLKRAQDRHILDANGQPDPHAFAVAAEDTDPNDIPVTLMAGVLWGKFNRDGNENYTAAPDQLQHA